jgi:hypothetical protein
LAFPGDYHSCGSFPRSAPLADACLEEPVEIPEDLRAALEQISEIQRDLENRVQWRE